VLLRNYQQWLRHDVLKALKTHQSVVAVLPTGGGKRYSIVDLCLLAMEHRRKVLVATNRRLLVDQMVKECQEHGVHYGVIMADYHEGDPSGPIQIASIQTLESWYLRPGLGAMQGVGLPDFGLLIIDEGHSQPQSYAQLRALRPDAKVLAFTATPVGSEGKSLVPGVYDTMVEGATNSELIANGFLLPTTVYAPSEPDIEGVKIVKRGEYNQSQLGRRVHECTVFGDVLREWEQYARDRATVCFVPGIPFGRDLVRQFNFLLGPGQAHLIEAKTPHHEREEIFEKIRSGESKIVVSVDVLREGFDLPVLQVAIDLQPNSQLRSYWQKIGRIKRPYPGQDRAIYLDFAGNYWRFTHPNEDPIWPQGEEDTQSAIKAARKAGAASQPIMCPKCSLVRERGPVCPGCGYKCGEAIRRIRMGNGKLKEIPAHQKEKREKTEAERLYAKWKSRLFAAMHSGCSYSQAARLFHMDTSHYPKDTWPGVFPKDDVRWRQKPADQYTMRDLAVALRRTNE
jgi:DNA repair protein RadD